MIQSTIPFLVTARIGYGLQHENDTRTSTFTGPTVLMSRPSSFKHRSLRCGYG
ncbi:hypothetical protein SERLADRAFT_374017 [Serpula lacrymans var. lacrymans S7.9]|uniref:Uncharacterized protein n=1 Tax=Serpula lacrymans var. lacrymans (strain S7.9) TaxID=578457 RepID=F8P9W2_SERL9|nr:uncharacterized protein SERLADRAFT_374017 [Serpula lacrymans var. lacrymans S7.9]EGO19960.1 hypothetical protein SERLADRAFT_374017 [Serpula lacrymans var. lacrymans S7.9]